jgi:uncharacterized membrane protein YhaH (DUF805 family)
MRGNVIGFDPDTNTGAISGHDGNRYDFVTQEWRGQSRPRHGDVVDFHAIEQRATEIYLIEPVYVTPNLGQFYFSPNGRISRSQYWLKFVLPYTGIIFTLEVIAGVAGIGSATYLTVVTILTIFSFVAFWSSIAILIKRVHDRNKTGLLVLFLFIPAGLFSVLLVAWIGIAVVAAAGDDAAAVPSLGVLGVLTIILGAIVMGINIWFFVEFGCMRGTIGANRFGPDPVRR